MIASIEQELHRVLLGKPGLMVLGAESCTGGLIAQRLSSVAGSSAWFWGECTTYSNESKTALLRVPQEVLTCHGAVSSETVNAMLDGLFLLKGDCLAYAVSGIAGPGGGSPEKPVGLVFIGVARGSKRTVLRYLFPGDRQAVRSQAADHCMKQMLDCLEGNDIA